MNLHWHARQKAAVILMAGVGALSAGTIEHLGTRRVASCVSWLWRVGGKRHEASAFSLVELLVVITVVAMLASLLLPALTKAKEEARTAMCRSNLHQLGIALRTYLDGADGVYPYSLRMPAANSRGVSLWFDALAIPDAKWGEGVFRCPGYPGVSYGGESILDSRGRLAGVHLPCGSYAYNALGRRLPFAGPSGWVGAGIGFTLIDGQPAQLPVRENDVKAPADLYVLGDALVGMCPWGTVRELRLGGASDYNSLVGGTPRLERVQHGSRLMMLFADTHAEGVPTGVLLGTNAACRSRWNHDHAP